MEEQEHSQGVILEMLAAVKQRMTVIALTNAVLQ